MRKSGFTLIELIMVIVILGILAAVAIPKYQDIRAEAYTAAQKGVVGAVRSGILVYSSANLVRNPGQNNSYPSQLDNASVGATASTSSPFFTEIIDGGVTDSNWTKTGTGNYRYTNVNGNTTYTYTSSTGSFSNSN